MDCKSTLSQDAQGKVEGEIKTPLPGTIMTPYVKVWFEGSDFSVSVGNASSPTNDNHTIIKSFNYGFSGASGNGSNGITVEIVDEEGGDFSNFVTKLLPSDRDPKRISDQCNMKFQFGWIITDCTDKQKKYLSQTFQCFAFKASANVADGFITFVIEGVHPVSVIDEGVSSETKIYGSQKNPIPLKEAITKMFKDSGVNSVKFLKKKGGPDCGNPFKCCTPDFTADSSARRECEEYVEWKFKNEEDNCKGQKSAWRANNRDPVSAAMYWLQNKITADDKSFIVGSCNKDGDQSVVFWESPMPNCGGKIDGLPSIGTYFVNGGNCSSVISFNPQINFFIQNVGQGGTQDANTQKTVPAKNDCKLTGKGTAETGGVPDFNRTAWGDKAGERTAEAHSAAARAQPTAPSISAELTVLGDPYLDNPMDLSCGRRVSIVVFNPLTLHASFGNCPKWLAQPPLNEMLTNKNWMVQGCSHQIKDGQYTTTLKVFLMTPGVDLPKGSSLGSDSSAPSTKG